MDESAFTPLGKLDRFWKEWIIEALRDWGSGLDVRLYEEAATHVVGGESHALREVDIIVGGCKLGTQKLRLTGPEVALKVTTLAENDGGFELHARRFLEHTSLQAIQWLNITRQLVTFRTLRRG